MEDFTSSELARFLTDQGISQDVVDAFEENEVCGKTFLGLTELSWLPK